MMNVIALSALIEKTEASVTSGLTVAYINDIYTDVLVTLGLVLRHTSLPSPTILNPLALGFCSFSLWVTVIFNQPATDGWL